MKITVLGSCSGTEPMPNRKHVSFVVEANGGVYWFDAGEGCSYTAHLLGIDLLSVRAIFISHTHMDHIGGLGNLLWNMRKINGVTREPGRKLAGKRIDTYLPNLAPWDGIMQMLRGTEGNFKIDYDLGAERVHDGEIFNDGAVRVVAQHNLHLGEPTEGEHWQSYSFRIECGNRAVVYSGDVRSVDDVAPILNPCDLFLMETGHHKVEDVCQYLMDTSAQVGQLMFIHHGRAILDDPERERRKGEQIMGRDVLIADDGTVVDLG